MHHQSQQAGPLKTRQKVGTVRQLNLPFTLCARKKGRKNKDIQYLCTYIILVGLQPAGWAVEVIKEP